MSKTAAAVPKTTARAPAGRAVPVVQRKCAAGGAKQCECEECRKSAAGVQRSATAPAAPARAPRIVHEALRSPGHPLDAGERNHFESRFGHDFGKVRIHT